MPVYTYRCDSCGVQFDRQQKFTDQPLTRCPECDKKALRKVYTPVGIVFKGSGFYATDHRSPSGAGRSGAAKASEGDSEKKAAASSSAESASETAKPASKPATTSSSE